MAIFCSALKIQKSHEDKLKHKLNVMLNIRNPVRMYRVRNES